MREECVLVEWYDSYGCTSKWEPVSELVGTLLVIKTVGFKVYEDKSIIKVANSVGEETEDTIHQCNGVMSIPKCCIKKIKTISFS